MMIAATEHDFDATAIEYRGRFLATARRLLPDHAAAQDVVQDAMLSAVRNLPRFRGDSQMSTWLGRIVINSALSRRRVIRRRPEQSLETLLAQPEPKANQGATLAAQGPSPEGALLHGEARELLRAAVEKLPRVYRTVVIMRHYQEARIADIAARLRITPNAAKLRLLRAHRALRRLLESRGYHREAAPAMPSRGQANPRRGVRVRSRRRLPPAATAEKVAA
jgi:RNA polymerase sigma factor (sigma-70 family)